MQPQVKNCAYRHTSSYTLHCNVYIVLVCLVWQSCVDFPFKFSVKLNKLLNGFAIFIKMGRD